MVRQSDYFHSYIYFRFVSKNGTRLRKTHEWFEILDIIIIFKEKGRYIERKNQKIFKLILEY